jgi:molybdate transport system substrate-binding protein
MPRASLQILCRPGLALGLAVLMAALALVQPVDARDSRQAVIAVAANFTEPAKAIAATFEAATGLKVVLSFGATGQLYAQIVHGAPFDVLLAADRTTPAKAVAEGLAVEGTAVTYAIGRLVLYSRDKAMVQGDKTLRDAKFSRIAIANPSTAPYGAAAIEVMTALGVRETLKARIVQGNSIAQTFNFVDTGNAELGFVALSQVVASEAGSRWLVPASLHTPIAQDAVLLKNAAAHPAAKAFLAYLLGPEARKLIERFGYSAGSER